MAQPYYSVKNSKIHGKGVFAKRPIRKGVRVIEYTGPVISIKEADKIGNTIDENGHGHTMFFTVDEKRVIDGNRGGDAKWINHSCSPNCEAIQDGDQVFIESLRAIKTGEEITYDYNLVVEEKITPAVLKEFECFCGSPNCRHSQIDKRILAKQARKDKLKAAKRKAKAEKKQLKAEMKRAKAEAKEKAKAQKKAAKKEKKQKKDKGGKKKGEKKSKKKNKK